MSAVSGRTRLGLEILGAGAALGIWGDVLLRAVPWGLNALLCTAGLVAAAAGLARRHRVAVSSDAPWLAAAALIIASNFVARDSSPLRAIDCGAVLGHIALFGILTVLAAGYLRGALLRAAPSRSLTEGDSKVALGIIPVATALGLVDLLFLVFVVIQVRYLFGGAELIATATGLTYAEYARRGFFELVTASALVLPLLTGADWLVRNESREHQRTFRQLALVLLLLLAVVMASAFTRMRLYVSEYGLSEDRLYATAFMLYLGGLFGWLAWTTLRGARRRFAFGGLVQGFAMLGVLHLVNPDVLIVRTNLARPAAERPFDGWYAASLSADVVPVLLEALPRLDGRAQCGVAAGLRQQLERLEGDDWRNWNFARARARRLLRDQEARLHAIDCPTNGS